MRLARIAITRQSSAHVSQLVACGRLQNSAIKCQRQQTQAMRNLLNKAALFQRVI